MWEPGVRALTWPSAGWMDLELVVVPLVESLDQLRMKRISLFFGKRKELLKDCKNTLFWKKCHCLKIAQDQEGSCP